jgi:hypothetical protein
VSESKYPGSFISSRDEALETPLGGFKAILARRATEAAAGVAVHYVEVGDRAQQFTRRRRAVRMDVSSAAVDHL